jgi:hypothetical protein
MKRDNLNKLKLALGAAAIVGASVQPALSYDINANTFLGLVQDRIEAGELGAAQQLIRRMRAMGVDKLMAGGVEVSLTELLTIITDPTPASRRAVADLLLAARSNQIDFVVGNRRVAAVQTTQQDSFPVGSAG